MHLILQLFAAPGPDHRAVFQAFAEGLGRVLGRRRALIRLSGGR